MQDRTCSEYFIDSALKTLKHMTSGALKVKQNKKSNYTLERLLGARSAQGDLQSDIAISFQGMV